MREAERSMALDGSVKQTFAETLAHSHMLIGALIGEGSELGLVHG